jgi:hypothetical protein
MSMLLRRLLRRLLPLSRLLLVLCLEGGKQCLIASKLLRRGNAIDARTCHVSIRHRVLLARVLHRLTLVVGMRYPLHVRSLHRSLTLTHVCLRDALRIHMWHSQMSITHWHRRPLLVVHLSIGSGGLLTRGLATWGLLRGLWPLLSWRRWNPLLRAEHLGISLLLSLHHLLATLAVDLGHLQIPLVSRFAELLRCRHRATLLRSLILLRRFTLGCSTLRLSLLERRGFAFPG